MMALSRLVCIIWASVFMKSYDEDEQDENWELLLQHQTLTDIAFSPTLNNSVLDFFAGVYEEHLLLFQQLFPILPIKPKQHYLVHFKSMVLMNGSLTYSCCFKYELRNTYFKRLAHIVCNLKNIPKTLNFRNQLTFLWHTIQRSRIRNVCVATVARREPSAFYNKAVIFSLDAKIASDGAMPIAPYDHMTLN